MNGLAHSRQSIVPVDGMQQYSQNSGNFFLGGSYFSPPFDFQGLLRVYEPGTSMFLPWPQRYCVLRGPCLSSGIGHEGPGDECMPGGLSLSLGLPGRAPCNFLLCARCGPRWRGSPIFEEFFATDACYESESWIHALRSCQRSRT